jgi:hypothetical protein
LCGLALSAPEGRPNTQQGVQGNRWRLHILCDDDVTMIIKFIKTPEEATATRVFGGVLA